jgi:peptidoglycan hydrolase-like protein with peptidoglycan-binding domain
MKQKLLVISTVFAASAGVAYILMASPRDRGEAVVRDSKGIKDSSIAAAFIASNSGYKFTDGVSRRGWSMIHRLSPETALRVEEALRRAAGRTGLPVNYLAAYVLQESTGDPKAEYRNPTLWDAAKDERAKFAATDHGLVQISGRNLLDRFPTLTLGELKAKAEGIDFAADFLADYVVDDLRWASGQNVDAIEGIDKNVVAKAKNPYWLAALSYNRGRPGAISALSNRGACRHADLVISAWARIDARIESGPTAEVRAPVFPAEPESDPRRLAVGDIGPGVEALQRLLNDRLAANPPLATDGIFGPATRDALIRFQRFRNLEPTGAADTKTWDALMDLTGVPGAPKPLAMGDKGPRVETLQQLLNVRLSPNPSLATDGNFGPATRDALIRFQRAHRIAPTGAADAATWEALNAPAKASEATTLP